MNNMKVLSLFDGISCGYLALQRAGIPIETYYASEIDKTCIKVRSCSWARTSGCGMSTAG